MFERGSSKTSSPPRSFQTTTDVKLSLLLAVAVFALALLGLVACAGGLPRDLREKKLDQPVTVDLFGLASAALPPTFKRAGVVNSGERSWFGGDLTPLEYHLDERRLTVRFLQGQHNTIGGYQADPVLLDVTLFNSNVPREEIERVTSTTIGRFYSPDNKTTLNSASWLPEERAGDAVLRSGEAIDPYDKKHPRWLLIHTDAARRARVDLFAWRNAYTIEEARRLVRDVATSLTSNSGLQRHFDEIKTFDQRMSARRDSVIVSIERALAACGVTPLAPDSAVASADCVARLSSNRRNVFIARYLGSVPSTAATQSAPSAAPEFAIGPAANEYSGAGSIDGRPNLDVFVLWWDVQAGRWRTGKLQGGMDNEELAAELEPDVAHRLGARDHAHFFRYVSYDVVFHPDRANAAEFLQQAARLEADLAAGKIVAGVRATKTPLGRS